MLLNLCKRNYKLLYLMDNLVKKSIKDVKLKINNFKIKKKINNKLEL